MEIKTYSCETCKLIRKTPFKTAKALQRHMAQKHPEQQQPDIEQEMLKCPEPKCEKVFKIQKCLEKHIDTKHKKTIEQKSILKVYLTRNVVRSQEERLGKMISTVEKVLDELVEMKKEVSVLLN
jgi:uncharacterized C2H2 Zn-finger protein